MIQLRRGFLGFPPPLLSEAALKLNCEGIPGEWIAVEKPQGIKIRATGDSTDQASPNLESGLQAQAQRDLPSWQEWGITKDYRPKSIFTVDTEAAAFGLWALNDASLATLRNAYGSDKLDFTYTFLARDTPNSGEGFEVFLPVTQHNSDPNRYLISSSTGKKAVTDFSKIQTWPKFGIALWEAKTTQARGHQIRLHAQECGLIILGETIYENEPGISLADLKRRRISKREKASQPLWPGLNLSLSRIDGEVFPENTIAFPNPKAFDTLLRKLDQFS